MKVHRQESWWIAAILAVIATAAFAGSASAQPGSPPGENVNQGMDVLTRGPVHEAFAETVNFNPEPGIIAPRAPREIIEEMPPDQRPDGANVTWIPGYWGWDDERNDYLWISGVWRDLPPGRQWVPGYWGAASQGVQWTSGYWADAGMNEIEYLPQPPESIEVGPNIAAPAINQGWVPGSWMWNQNRYAWRPGYWAAGRANWVWVPAHYVWAPRGYVFSEGYWDYPVARRGVLFAPVYFQQEVYSRPHFAYSPSVVINLAVFSDQLFVRPSYRHYYFGDYYDSRYESSGFFASFSYQSSRYGYDPIYAHRRWENRRDRDWDRRDRDAFAYRRATIDARPPRTLLAQRELGTRGIRSGETRIEAAVSYEQYSKRKESAVRFQKVDNTERQELSQRGRAIQNNRIERQKIETRSVEPRKDDRPARSLESTRARLPKPTVVARPINQLKREQAPPKRHKVPAPDPKVQPRTRSAEERPDARKQAPDNRANPPESRKPDRDSQRGESRDDSRGGSKDKPKKSKGDPKNKS